MYIYNPKKHFRFIDYNKKTKKWEFALYAEKSMRKLKIYFTASSLKEAEILTKGFLMAEKEN